MFPTPLASDNNKKQTAAVNMNVYLSDNGIFRKKNKNGAIWSLPLSAAVFYMTPVASDGIRSKFPPEVMRKSKDGANLAAQVRRLMAEHAKLRGLCDRMKTEGDALRKENRTLQERVRSLEEELSCVRLAEGLAGGGRNRERARARVNRLVREVDRCIALLNRQQE